MVGFRAACQAEARRLGLTGWVRNRIESWPIIGKGVVEVVAEGDRKSVYKLVNWCKKGSTLAHVDKVEVEYDRATGEFSDFEIKY